MTCVRVVDHVVVLLGCDPQLEASASWPEDMEAIDSTKVAFYLKIREWYDVVDGCT